MASKTGRRQKRHERSRRQASSAAPGASAPQPARKADPRPRKGKTTRSPRWMLLAAIVTTIAACADAAVLAVSTGNDRWLYGVGLVLWVLLAGYHWNHWLGTRKRS